MGRQMDQAMYLVKTGENAWGRLNYNGKPHRRFLNDRTEPMSDVLLKAETEAGSFVVPNKMNALVWNKGRWSLHLFPLTRPLTRSIDGSQARYLRRILKVPASFISRISHKIVRSRYITMRFSIFIFRAQLRWLAHILRKPPDHPLCLVLFYPNTDLLPRVPHYRPSHEGRSRSPER